MTHRRRHHPHQHHSPRGIAGQQILSVNLSAAIYSVAISDDGLYVLAGAVDGTVSLLAQALGQLWRHRVDSAAMGTAFLSSRTPQTILVTSERGGQLIWLDMRGSVIETFQLPSLWLRGLEVTSDGRYAVVSTSGTGGIRLIDLQRRAERWFALAGFSFWHVAVCNDAKRIVAASRANFLTMLDFQGRELWRFERSRDFVGAAISADGDLVVGSCWDDCIYALDGNGQLRWRYKSPAGSPKGLAMTRNGEYIAVGMEAGGARFGGEGGVLILSRTGQVLWEQSVKGGCGDVAITQSGTHLALGLDTAQSVQLWRLPFQPTVVEVASGRFSGAQASARVLPAVEGVEED